MNRRKKEIIEHQHIASKLIIMQTNILEFNLCVWLSRFLSTFIRFCSLSSVQCWFRCHHKNDKTSKITLTMNLKLSLSLSISIYLSCSHFRSLFYTLSRQFKLHPKKFNTAHLPNNMFVDVEMRAGPSEIPTRILRNRQRERGRESERRQR